MEAKHHFLQKENIEKNPDFIEVKRLADEILAILNDPVISEQIRIKHGVDAKSTEIQEILSEKIEELGYQSIGTQTIKVLKQ